MAQTFGQLSEYFDQLVGGQASVSAGHMPRHRAWLPHSQAESEASSDARYEASQGQPHILNRYYGDIFPLLKPKIAVEGNFVIRLLAFGLYGGLFCQPIQSVVGI